MWAPADVFTPVTNAVLSHVKRLFSYFSEHPVVLVAVVVGIGLIIALVELLRGRARRE